MIRSMVLLSLVCAVVLAPAAAPAQEQQWRARASMKQDMGEDDIAAEVRFGREVAARIVGRYSVYEGERINRYINLVGSVVAQNTGRPELAFHFGILDTAEINAYAAPGGYVFVTKGALAQMRDESELAAVLAHEIAHITGRHVVKELNIRSESSSGTSGLARLIGGSTEASRTAFAQAADMAVDMLFKNGYKREDEAQADREAVQFTALSGYDGSALIRYFERIGQFRGKQTEVLDRTHPSYDVRIAAMRDAMAAEGIAAGGGETRKVRFDSVMQSLK